MRTACIRSCYPVAINALGAERLSAPQVEKGGMCVDEKQLVDVQRAGLSLKQRYINMPIFSALAVTCVPPH